MGRIKLGRPFTKKRLVAGLPIIAVLAVAVALLIFLKNLNGPSEGTIIQDSAKAQPPTKDPYAAPGKYDGKYVSFSYPADYKITASQTNSGYLDVLSLISTDPSSKNISVEVVRENLQNDSGYNHRRTFPQMYKQLPGTPNSVVFASNQNGSEQTGFIVHNDLVASVSLTANGNPDLSQDYNTIASSLKWKQ